MSQQWTPPGQPPGQPPGPPRPPYPPYPPHQPQVIQRPKAMSTGFVLQMVGLGCGGIVTFVAA
ncbi:MAG TPA: hypothetical protein PLF26_06260, partial [Blastocatellia bacterium]|nr:hypothetical protein [Blastocatellia bacterium]